MTVPLLRVSLVTSSLAACVAAALAAQAPVDTAAVTPTADTAAHAWLALVDKGEIAKSWDEAALSFQLGVTKTKWTQLVVSARAPFAPLGARHQTMPQHTPDPHKAPPGRHVTL